MRVLAKVTLISNFMAANAQWARRIQAYEACHIEYLSRTLVESENLRVTYQVQKRSVRLVE